MKKALFAIVTAALLIGGCTSQRPTTSDRYDRRDDYEYGRNDRYDRDRDRDDYEMRETGLERRLQRWENELDLSNRQKRQIRDIQERYEQRGLTREERNDRYAYRKIQQQKRQELLSVLTPAQRDRLSQLEQRNRGYNDRRG
ncbi:hypothetical protein [Larkinella soli]|uniref:hypothetical protein n=1 Tax=Larkinella soli TaxID=1770527 RepID=UPI000FFBB585|nr:hypothetical protein [Larkinella soli]